MVAMPSRDIEICVSAADLADLRNVAAHIVRRESYFRAILVQSRGTVVRRCPQKCGNPNASPKFRHCVRLRDYQAGACAECVWQSHGARCAHHSAGDVSCGSSPGDDGSDAGDGGGGGRARGLPWAGGGGGSGSSAQDPVVL